MSGKWITKYTLKEKWHVVTDCLPSTGEKLSEVFIMNEKGEIEYRGKKGWITN